MMHGSPISQMLLVALPLSQLPPEMIARMARKESAAPAPGNIATGASRSKHAADALLDPVCRILIIGDESGRVKMWDADAIIALCNLPSLSDIVALALESAKVRCITFPPHAHPTSPLPLRVQPRFSGGCT